MNESDSIKQFLQGLISLPGVSGHESSICGAISEVWEPLTDEIVVTKVGNLFGIKRGRERNDGKRNRRILLAVHMDGIGMLVHKIEGEFLFFAPIGGFDPRILPGQFVIIHAEGEDIPGLIVQPPDHLLPDAPDGSPVPLERLMIDTGLNAREVKEKIRVGDIISYATKPEEMPTDCVSGHSLDNRASVAALTQCLNELQRFDHQWDVYATATVQEEVSYLGGTTAPYSVRPDAAIAIDVTFAKGPGIKDWRGFALESGPALGQGSNIHPAFFKAFKQLCEDLSIPYSIDILTGTSGTDGDPLQVALQGIPTIVISIPLRYMHTPVEVISMKDIMLTGHLLAEFIARLDENFIKQLEWEE